MKRDLPAANEPNPAATPINDQCGALPCEGSQVATNGARSLDSPVAPLPLAGPRLRKQYPYFDMEEAMWVHECPHCGDAAYEPLDDGGWATCQNRDCRLSWTACT